MTYSRIAIVTATYNRKNLIKRLYNSLANQTNNNFTWLVVDDGSSDSTEEYIKSLNSNFDILYVKQNNGGKGRALNKAFNFFNDFDLFVIVDSDDYLLPEAIDDISSKALKYNSYEKVGALFFRYQDGKGNLLTSKYANDITEEILSRIEHDSKYSKYDGCIAYYSKSITKYKYPEFPGEKYIGPTVIQLMMSEEYKIAFTQEVIGVAEYQTDGLTRSGRKIRINNPKGMILYCQYMQDKGYSLFNRIKYRVMENAYGYLLEKNNKHETYSPKTNIYNILGAILGFYWQIKYVEKR